MNDPAYEVRHDTSCRICRGNSIPTVLSFQPTPAEDQFVTKEELSRTQKCYPLDVALCSDCGYVFLPHVLNPEISYPNYIYVTQITLGLPSHYREFASTLQSSFDLPSDGLAVDLGSNDGTMLRAFQELGMQVLGVEPGRAVAKIANEKGIPTINAFFDDAAAASVLETRGPAHVVTANYMYANIDDLHGFTKNVARILRDDGLFAVQTGYHPDQMKVMMFDYIYHEHFSYFTVGVLDRLFRDCGLELIDVSKSSAKGGSVRVVTQKAGGTHKRRPSVDEILNEERLGGVDRPELYAQFFADIQARKSAVRTLLQRLVGQKQRIVGYGASHSTTTLLYHFELAPYLEYLVDDNTIKHGRFSPGHHLPVYPSSRLVDDKPECVVVLAWPYSEAIIARNQAYLEAGGTFILPLPTLRLNGKLGLSGASTAG